MIIVVSLMELIFAAWLIGDIVKFRLAASAVFWVGAVIYVCMGLLWDKYYQRFRKDKRYNKSNFWFLPIMAIGIGAPYNGLLSNGFSVSADRSGIDCFLSDYAINRPEQESKKS